MVKTSARNKGAGGWEVGTPTVRLLAWAAQARCGVCLRPAWMRGRGEERGGGGGGEGAAHATLSVGAGRKGVGGTWRAGEDSPRSIGGPGRCAGQRAARRRPPPSMMMGVAGERHEHAAGCARGSRGGGGGGGWGEGGGQEQGQNHSSVCAAHCPLCWCSGECLLGAGGAGCQPTWPRRGQPAATPWQGGTDRRQAAPARQLRHRWGPTGRLHGASPAAARCQLCYRGGRRG